MDLALAHLLSEKLARDGKKLDRWQLVALTHGARGASHVCFRVPSGELPRWRDYFDIVICSAKKPSWFSSNTPFMKLEDEHKGTFVQASDPSFVPGRVYERGNLQDFERMAGIRGLSQYRDGVSHVAAEIGLEPGLVLLAPPGRTLGWQRGQVCHEPFFGDRRRGLARRGVRRIASSAARTTIS